MFAADLARLAAATPPTATGELLLIGRREVRSNNSWMHNAPRLVKGKPRHQLLVHPDGPRRARHRRRRRGSRCDPRRQRSRSKPAPSPGMMPGVVCLPHGYGHDRAGMRLARARRVAGPKLQRPHRPGATRRPERQCRAQWTAGPDRAPGLSRAASRLRHAAPAPAQRKAALIFSSVAAPGHRSVAPSDVERNQHGVEVLVQVVRLGIDVDQAGHDLALRVLALHVVHRPDAVARIVLGVELVQAQDRAVVLRAPRSWCRPGSRPRSRPAARSRRAG